MLKFVSYPFLLILVIPGYLVASDQSGNTISVTDQGVHPPVLRLSSDELMVFILNKTTDSLVTFEVNYGQREVHCSNDNVVTSGHGMLRSQSPIVPRDFTALCFHGSGRYPVKIFGIPGTSSARTVYVELNPPELEESHAE